MTDAINQPLIERMQALYGRATAGDKNAETILREMADRSRSGDSAAKVALNTLTVLHYRSFCPGEWAEASKAYERVASQNPEAVAWFETVKQASRAGNEGSRRLLNMLNAARGMREASAWAIPRAADTEGNVRVRNLPMLLIGAHPFPHFPAIPNQTLAGPSPDEAAQKVFSMPRPTLAEEYTLDHSESATIRQRPSLQDEYNAGEYNASTGALLPSFPPVTALIERQLITMMMRAAASLPAPVSVQAPPVATDPMSNVAVSAPPATDGGGGDRRARSVFLRPGARANVNTESVAKPTAHLDGGDTLSSMASYGMAVVANEPDLIEQRRQYTVRMGPNEDWNTGFYVGLVASAGSAQRDERSQTIRDRLASEIGVRERTVGNVTVTNIQDMQEGFDLAERIMNDWTRAGRGVTVPQVVKSFQRVSTSMSEADQAAFRGDQPSICGAAARAAARNSPAAPNLAAQCLRQRQANIAQGKFVADEFTSNDGDFRVALANAGEAVVAASPKMGKFRSTLPASQQRGFTMAMGVRAGQMDEKFVEFVKPGLAGDPELLKGFLDGMRM